MNSTNDNFGAIFSLATRFATKIAAMNLPPEVIQRAKESGDDHPLWRAIEHAMFSEEMPMSSGSELGSGKAKRDTSVLDMAIPNPEVFVPRIQILSERPKPCARRSTNDQVNDLKQMYDELQWTWTESFLVIPRRHKGFHRLLVFTDPALTNKKVFSVCNASFHSHINVDDDPDTAFGVGGDQHHPSQGEYAVWVRDDEHPDRELMGLSANRIVDRGYNTLTLLERMFFELVYYKETGQHLDRQTHTLCAGSRRSDCGVPSAGYNGVSFAVSKSCSSCTDPYSGARQVIAT